MNEFIKLKEIKEILKENLKYVEDYGIFDYEKLFDFNIKMASIINDKELIDQICKSKSFLIKMKAAEYGSDEMHWELINDNNWLVRAKIAKYGINAIRWKLIDDKSKYVREIVAEYGNDEMRWKLIDDEDAWVRSAVAEYGTKEMCEILKNDIDYYVKEEAENRLEELKKKKRKRGVKYERL